MTLDSYKSDSPVWEDGDEVAGCRFYSDKVGHCY